MTTTNVEIIKPTLSPSAFGQYDICQRRGQFYHERPLPRRVDIKQAVGIAWHHMMEAYQRTRMQVGDGEFFVIDTTEWADALFTIGCGYLAEIMRPEDPGLDTLEWGMTCLDDMLATFTQDTGIRWHQARILFIEEPVRVEFGSDAHQMTGIIDLGVSIEPLGTILVDHKSAGRAWGGSQLAGDPRKAPQSVFYTEAWVRLTGERVDWFAYDVMTRAGKFQRVWCYVPAEVRKPFIDRWLNMSQTITLHAEAGIDMPTNPGHYMCAPDLCDYWILCPMGEDMTRLIERTANANIQDGRAEGIDGSASGAAGADDGASAEGG